MRPADALGDDILRGIKAIAAFIGENERRTYYLAENNLIPCGKLGAVWIGSKSTLREHYARLVGGVAR